MAVDIDYIRSVYFAFDKPVPYPLKCGVTIQINPVKMSDSMIFMSSYGILDIDKNDSNDVEIIQMPYLKYLAKYILIAEPLRQQLANICIMCLGFTAPFIRFDEKQKAILSNIRIVQNEDGEDTVEELFYITSKEFEEIKKIILYQNLPSYDDAYIDPELKANMLEMDSLKAKGITMPSLERRMAIISSHTGITKKEQMDMTLRFHTILFEEVVGEVEYMSMKAIACYGGKSDDIQWIYKKSKGKYDEYITSVEKYNKSMGGDGKINKNTQSNEDYITQYGKFIGG